MENQDGQRTDIEKLGILLPRWYSHNNEHIREQEKWINIAEDAGLDAVADELRRAVDCSKKAGRHIELADSHLKRQQGLKL